MTFGKRLSTLRRHRGLSRMAFSDLLSVPYPTLSNYENDLREPSHAFLLQAAAVLAVSTDVLLGAAPFELPPTAHLLSHDESTLIARYRSLRAPVRSTVDALLQHLSCAEAALSPNKGELVQLPLIEQPPPLSGSAALRALLAAAPLVPVPTDVDAHFVLRIDGHTAMSSMCAAANT